jgi:hypothetical protein
VLRELCGLQAQVRSAAWLGVRARSAGLLASDLDRALTRDRSIVRGWLMRGTLHVVAAEDLGWLLQLLGPLFARSQAVRHAQLGLTDDLKARGVKAIQRILANSGPLTRYELVDRLRPAGIALDPRSQAPIHLIQLAALEGVLCLGPDRDNGEPTYVLIDDWLGGHPPAVPRSGLAELARRYFRAYGPATVDDLSAWSGLPAGQARRALAEARAGLAEVALHGVPAYLLKGRLDRLMEPAAAVTDVRLLPAFDTYLLGYRRRDLAVTPDLQRRLQRGGGWLHPAVVVNGRAVGAWNLRTSRATGRVRVESFGGLSAVVRRGIEAEVRDIARFLDRSLAIEVAP